MPRMTTPPADIYLVDDDALFREEVRLLLTREGYSLAEFEALTPAREALARHRPLVLLLDIQLPDGKGTDLLAELSAQTHPPEIVMVSGAASLQEAADSIKRGATDFLEKPFEPARLLTVVGNALRIARLKESNRSLQEKRLADYPLVGGSAQMAHLLGQIERLASSDVRILILGESGTGKENVAAQIHFRSPRAEGSLVTLNCSAMPAELVESELFGHEKGAFTGATQSRPGRFAQAHRGTLLLDEIGDMPLAMQPKLLRTLESGRITPVGGERPTAVDVRVLSATHRRLDEMVAGGQFREDLLYRINTVPLTVPPLRERREDIPSLAEHFRDGLHRREGGLCPAITPEALDLLMAHPWPGNVRELRNVIERLYYTCGGDSIDATQVRPCLGPNGGETAAEDGKNRLTRAVEQFERGYLRSQLEGHGGNITQLAQDLGVDRGNLYRKLKRLGLLSS